MNNQVYSEIVKMLRSSSVTDALGWMAVHGSSVVLNWGEDDNLWECSWITSGKRFTAFREEIPDAIKDVLGKVRNDMLKRGARE